MVGTVEANVAIKNNAAPEVYSEQQLVDCCSVYDTNCMGCNEGWTGSGFDYIAKIGLTTSALYPYQAVASACQESTVAKSFYLQTASSFSQDSGKSKALSLLAQGPVSVILDASLWKSYQSGIMTCNTTVTYNHAVILVGYWRVHRQELLGSSVGLKWLH